MKLYSSSPDIQIHYSIVKKYPNISKDIRVAVVIEIQLDQLIFESNVLMSDLIFINDFSCHQHRDLFASLRFVQYVPNQMLTFSTGGAKLKLIRH